MDVVLGLLAKKQSGFRNICTISSTWRVFMACMSPELRKWDAASSKDFDSAVKGRSASGQVMKCGVMESAAKARRLHTVDFWGTSAVSTKQLG